MNHSQDYHDYMDDPGPHDVAASEVAAGAIGSVAFLRAEADKYEKLVAIFGSEDAADEARQKQHAADLRAAASELEGVKARLFMAQMALGVMLRSIDDLPSEVRHRYFDIDAVLGAHAALSPPNTQAEARHD